MEGAIAPCIQRRAQRRQLPAILRSGTIAMILDKFREGVQHGRGKPVLVMKQMRYGRWLVLVCVAALVSCMVLPRIQNTEPTAPDPLPSPEQSSVILTEHRGDPWLLRFPKYWVENNRCQIYGDMTMILTWQDNHLDGKLPWVWNNQQGAATLTGTISSGAIAMTLEPPAMGGFAMSFEGQQSETAGSSSGGTASFSGTVNPKGVCRQQQGGFTLTPLPRLTPSPQMKQRLLFSRPFELEYLMTNYFDHDVPRQFQDTNGYIVNWDGKSLPVGSLGASIDGHGGYDWALPEGTPLLAVADGTVTFAGNSQPFFCPLLNQETVGLEVYIDHPTPEGDRFESEYIHLSRVDVAPGQMAKAGEVIGLSGNTGCSTGPHLHFGVYHHRRQRTVLVDPYGWAAPTPDPWQSDRSGTESLWLWRDGQAPILYEYGR